MTEILTIETLLPAVGQGIRESRSAIATTRRATHESTGSCRDPLGGPLRTSFLRTLGGSCQTPIAGHASIEAGELAMKGLVISPDGQQLVSAKENGRPFDAEGIGERLAQKLLETGADKILAASKMIDVSHLTKTFRVAHKEPGLAGALKGLFTREYRDVHAVRDISFSIKEGELVGFLGPNGAGKTTTLKMLSGLLHPSSGEASVLGHVPWKRERDFQKQFTMVMGQRTQLWWDLPAWDSFLLNKEIYEIPKAQFEAMVKTLRVCSKSRTFSISR